MKRIITAVALSFALSSAALAGDIPSVGITAPLPSGPTATASSPGDIPSVRGEIPTGGLAVTASDVLNLLQTMFSLM